MKNVSEREDTVPAGGEFGSPIDLRRIRHFVVLAETLNFRRAAERLHMAQPPLTVSIQKLEEYFSAKLFTRDTSGVSLTPAGRAILEEAKGLLIRGSHLRDIVKHSVDGTEGVIRIGFTGSTIYGMLQKLLPAFRAKYPGVELALRESTSVEIMRDLENNVFDVGLIRMPLLKSSSAKVIVLEREACVAALPRDCVLAKKNTLELADLSNEAFVMYSPTHAAGINAVVRLACQQAGFSPRVVQEATQIQTVLALVEAGLGVALVPSITQHVVSPKVVYRPFSDYPTSASIGLGFAYMEHMESPAARKLREMACSIYTGAN